MDLGDSTDAHIGQRPQSLQISHEVSQRRQHWHFTMAIFNSKLEDRADFLMAAITAAGYGYACYDNQRGGEFYLSPLALGIMGFTAPIAEPPTS